MSDIMDVWSQVSILLLLDILLMLAGQSSGGSGRRRSSGSPHIQRLLKRYNRQNPPNADKPTEIRLGVYINSFYSISDETMDYSVNIYLRQTWIDPRLKFPTSNINGTREMVKLADGMWDVFWVPDVFFRNEKSASFHEVTMPNRLMRLYSTGQVWYATKISATLSCPMKLQKYPLDTQRCPMQLESFGHTTDTVIFNWWDTPIDMEKSLELPQFNLVHVVQVNCLQNYSTGAYPCLQLDFVLKRDFGYFLIQIYIPSLLVVIISWVSFWINFDAVPARVTLGLLTVLTMTTQTTAGQTPRVSYIKALDVWMSVCLLFVFASLIEFAVVNVFSRKEIRRMRTINPMLAETARLNRDPESFPMRQIKVMENGSALRDRPNLAEIDHVNRAKQIDKVSRRAFPFAFLIFNIIYWVVYTVF